MICRLCGSSYWLPVFRYSKPDKYEKWVGLDDIERGWFQCGHCRFYQSWRNYDVDKLEEIYIDGYRSEEFRDEPIHGVFERINSIPFNENSKRVAWFLNTAKPNFSASLLDVGSGLGIWPKILSNNGIGVECVDINNDSIEFIKEELGLPCTPCIPKNRKYDYVSCIHTLEHIQDPEDFLLQLKESLKEDGRLFIEVPDAIEFEYLKEDHDEFNSCHLSFYDVPNLVRVVEFCGFVVTDISREYRNQRDLSRIRLIARRG